MAEECTADSSIATSSTAPTWWDYNSSSLYSWNTSPLHTQNPSSNSSCEEDVSISTSFTNFSNRSGLTGESSPRIIDHLAASYEFIGEHTSDSNRWTNVLIQDVKENYLDILSSRSSLSSSAARMFEEPARACDYLKKMDTTNTWELTNSAASSSNFDKQFNVGFVDNIDINEGDRLSNKLSSFVSNGTFDPQAPQPCLRSLGSPSVDHCLQTDLSRMKQMFNDLNGISGLSNSCYGHDMNLNINGQHHDETETRTGDLLRRSISSANNIDGGLNSKYYHGLSESSCTNGRNFDDSVMFFGSNLIKPSLKSLILPDSKKQRPHFTSSLVKNNGRGHGNSNEGKKKRFEDNSETDTKKPKHEISTVSSVKKQAPKMKLGERITALQQIVSPFGKTDTASVLLEAIGYIKFLQEQVQLISNPYMKDTCTKDPWGNLDMKDRGDMKLDLKSRGLCLVPISCTPQVCRENTGSDYWIPTYRGCLYR